MMLYTTPERPNDYVVQDEVTGRWYVTPKEGPGDIRAAFCGDPKKLTPAESNGLPSEVKEWMRKRSNEIRQPEALANMAASRFAMLTEKQQRELLRFSAALRKRSKR